MSTSETEVQLRARVRALEDELEDERTRRRRQGQRSGDPRVGDWSDLTDRKVDELSRFFSGTIRAALEGIRVAADSASYFVEDVLERNVPERDESPSEVKRRLPTDLTRGVARSLDRAMDIPSRSINRFSRTYETAEQPGRQRRRTARSTRPTEERSRQQAVEQRDDYENWTKAELYGHATELEIEGRSEMTKEELIRAIQTAERPLEAWSKTELYERATELEIEGRSQMTREELIEAIRAAEPA
jgi:hypothetical protein